MPARKGEEPRFGGLGGVRQWVESIIDTIKGQLSLERHGAHTMPGLVTRVAQRLLALATGLWHNWDIGDPGRHLTATTTELTHTESVIECRHPPSLVESPVSPRPVSWLRAQRIASPSRARPSGSVRHCLPVIVARTTSDSHRLPVHRGDRQPIERGPK